MKHKKHKRKQKKRIGRVLVKTFLLFSALMFFIGGSAILWATTLEIPDINTFDERRISESTKIFDRTGEVLLYDIHEDIRRTIIPIDGVPIHVREAAIAIEDERFYEHKGVDIRSFLRAVFVNLKDREYTQGGSTITQQVVKNTFLTREKTITRKLKEWILAVKIETVLSKEKILEVYFNEVPYGGSIYGIEEASLSFFGKRSSDLSVAEGAYLAALPQAPTYFSPYGNNKEKLEARKNLVLSRMHEQDFLTAKEYATAAQEEVVFVTQEDRGFKAPHFVIFVREYLEEKYGREALENGGLRVVTTLDYELQQKAEQIAQKHGEENVTKFKANNASFIGMDPKTGQIIIMVGSRDYFNQEIDGNFNVAVTKNRQPGSAFKPFVYATAFEKGYTPDTVVFDLPTEFNTYCTPEGKPIVTEIDPRDCYMPENYDLNYRGPMSLRDALAQSVNVPAVKTFYLAGINNSIATARKLGISSLKSSAQYGLTLVLGSGEVSLFDMTSAYTVFAAEGIRHTPNFILTIEDSEGNILEEYTPKTETVLKRDVALMISDILSDNTARAPAFGHSSYLHFEGRQVAVKTGTTNDYRDAWIIGYTPSFALGAWVGNNNNAPMEKKVAGFIVAPMWNELMLEALKKTPRETFPEPPSAETNIKPILRGGWQGGESYFIDRFSGKLATEFTPVELREEKFTFDVHSILYWVDKVSPLGPPPEHPEKDPQFYLWETPVRKWVAEQGIQEGREIITEYDDVHKPEFAPKISFISPFQGSTYSKNGKVLILIQAEGNKPLSKVDFYFNNQYIGSAKTPPFSFSFIPNDIANVRELNDIKVVAYDTTFNKGEATMSLKLLPEIVTVNEEPLEQ